MQGFNIEKVIQELRSSYGKNFLDNITMQLHRSIDAQYTFIAKLDREKAISKTLSLVAGNEFAENFEYSLEYTPCEDVSNDNTCIYPTGICSLYPKDQLLIDMEIDGYVGAPLRDSSNRVFGIIVALYSDKIANASNVASLFELFAGRISAEIERSEKEKALKDLNKSLTKKTIELEAANNRFNQVLEATDIGIWSWDIETNENYWSPRFYSLLGFTNAEIEASFDEWESRLHPEDKNRVLQALNSHLEEGKLYRIEFRLRCKDNTYQWFRVKGNAQLNNDGQPMQMVGSLENINEQKRLSKAYQHEQEKFETFVNLAPIGIAINSLSDGKFLYINDEFNRFTGYSCDELNTMDYWDLTPQKYAEQEQAQLVNMQNTGEYGPYEKEYIHKKGHHYPVLLSGIRIKDANGNDVIWSVIQDNSERRASENKLSLAQQQADTLAHRIQLANNSAGIGVWEWDLTTNELVWDDWMYRLYGISHDSFSGAYEAWENSVHPDDIDDAKAELMSAIEGQGAYEPEFRVVHPDGNVRTMKASAEVIRDDAGNATKVIGVNYDITEKVDAIQNIKQAKQEAERANKAKSDFLANMSHEIRTPMNAILGGLQLLAGTSLDDSSKTILSKASYSAKSLLTIINDILDYSKIEENKLELEQAPFSCIEVLESVKYDLNQQANDKGIQLTTEINSNFKDGWLGDLVRVKQILLNLGSNAVKFTPKGKVEFKLRTVQLNNQSAIQFDVIDSGIGMSEEAQSRIFERFAQADTSTTRQFGGTGLGMSITVSLINMMQGSLNLQSEEGKGTQITVTLPLHKSDLPTAEKNKKSNTVPILEGKKLLIAEDNEINRVIIEQMLLPTRAELTLVENGLLAVEAIQKESFDLVLMDIHMPVMDGVEAQNKIKAINKSIPVIALTANVMTEDVNRYLASGFTSHIGKPIDMNTLYSEVEQYCS